jgi:hypothetical protein
VGIVSTPARQPTDLRVARHNSFTEQGLSTKIRLTVTCIQKRLSKNLKKASIILKSLRLFSRHNPDMAQAAPESIRLSY